jgi:hypothetical protein
MLPKVFFSSNANKLRGINLDSIIPKLDQIDIFATQSDAAKQLMQKEVDSFFNNQALYQVLMRVREGGQNTVAIYGRQIGNYIVSLIVFAKEGNDCVLIHLAGQFELQDIRELTAQ